MRNYVVTLKNKEDLDGFYKDMETINRKGPDKVIPGRKIECAVRRPISRNTVYLLTDEEAEEIRKDQRVLAVELTFKEQGIKIIPHWQQTADFDKDPTGPNDKNWALLRCWNGGPISGWGLGGSFLDYNTTIDTTSSGKNVDVVITDVHIQFDHPEFALNPDGTGGSRAVQLDWLQYSTEAGYVSNGSYDYGSFEANHGTHVAGSVAGNTQGWARSANIYSMHYAYPNTIPSGSPAPGEVVVGALGWTEVLFDYIIAWHNNKEINPNTGRRNPTIVNASWGAAEVDSDGGLIATSQLTQWVYRGTTTNVSNPSSSSVNAVGLITVDINENADPNGTYLPYLPIRSAALDADVQDAIDAGIVIVSAAGNTYWYHDVPTGNNYNNTFTYTRANGSSRTVYYHRGASPAAATGVISVGAVDIYVDERKVDFSDFGPRIDVFAPGRYIMSSVWAAESGYTLINDPRDSNYKLARSSGTSFASPQVAGVLACLAEQEPRMNQQDARDYINYVATQDQIGNTGDGNPPAVNFDWTDHLDLLDSPNLYLYYNYERPIGGMASPKMNYKRRPSSGAVYPRYNRTKTYLN